MMKKDEKGSKHYVQLQYVHIISHTNIEQMQTVLISSSFPIRSSLKRGEYNSSQAAVSQSLGCTYPWNGPGHVSDSNHDLVLRAEQSLTEKLSV